MAAAKRPRVPRARKRKSAAMDGVHMVTFTARLVENERAGLKCSCTFPDQCDGSRLIGCTGNLPPDGLVVQCDCAACGEHTAEHVTGCQGCEQCNKAECASCGKRAETELAEPGFDWTCSPECARKQFTVAS